MGGDVSAFKMYAQRSGPATSRPTGRSIGGAANGARVQRFFPEFARPTERRYKDAAGPMPTTGRRYGDAAGPRPYYNNDYDDLRSGVVYSRAATTGPVSDVRRMTSKATAAARHGAARERAVRSAYTATGY